jgi:hypothetical protein
MSICTTIGCSAQAVPNGSRCAQHMLHPIKQDEIPARRDTDMPMSEKYPKYYKPVPKGVDSIDTYAINLMFPVDDPTGAILHARKKLLVPGARTGGKSMIDDVREARDTLTRWLQLQSDFKPGPSAEMLAMRQQDQDMIDNALFIRS